MRIQPIPRPGWSAGARIALLAALLGLSAAPAFARRKTKKAPPPDLADEVGALAAKLYALPLDEAEPLTSQIQTRVLNHMDQWLSAHPPRKSPGSGEEFAYGGRVRDEMDNVFAKLRYPVEADPAAFAAPFGQHTLIGVGYELGWTDFNGVSVLALYETGEEPMRPHAVTTLVPATSLHYRVFAPPPSAAGQFWFLVYGTRQGKSNPRLSAVLYAFDGKALQPLWKRTDLFDGRISFPGDRVVISYLNENEFKEAVNTNSPVTRHEAAYHVGPHGFEVEYDR